VLLSHQFADDAVFVRLEALRRENSSDAVIPTSAETAMKEGNLETWHKNKLDDPKPLERFIIGLWGVVKGPVFVVEKFGEVHAEFPEYGYFDHPILALLEHLGLGRTRSTCLLSHVVL
jgi:hypothetical protein